MKRLMSKLSVRLALPLAAVLGILVLADPLPPPEGPAVATQVEVGPAASEALRIETERLGEEAQVRAEAARAAAASMRWMLTSPAAGRANRCLLGSCRES